jgi:GNAT superfamily N-acetyltransferase
MQKYKGVDPESITVKPFGEARVDDFYHLHSSKNDAGWCFCAAWWVGTWEKWGDRTADQNRIIRDELLARGEYDGYLLYIDHQPVGWCQVGPRDRLEKLTRQFRLAPDRETWAVTCFLIDPAYRRSGLAAYLLRQVLDDLGQRGVKRVEAFPRRSSDAEAMDLWNGPESMFLKAGFAIVRDHPDRPILAIELETPG